MDSDVDMKSLLCLLSIFFDGHQISLRREVINIEASTLVANGNVGIGVILLDAANSFWCVIFIIFSVIKELSKAVFKDSKNII